MGLYKRNPNPKKAIRITAAAEIIGCSAQAIRIGLVGNFKMFKLNPDRKTSPLLMYESELNHYLDVRDRQN